MLLTRGIQRLLLCAHLIQNVSKMEEPGLESWFVTHLLNELGWGRPLLESVLRFCRKVVD